MAKRKWTPPPVNAWAWLLEEGLLCRWAEPDKERLTARSKPSPGAKMVRVQIRLTPKRKKQKVPHG